MRSKLTLMLVALFAMAGIATAQTPQEAKAAKQKAKQAAAARRASIGEGTELVKNNFVRLYKRTDYTFDIELFQKNEWIGTTYNNGGYATFIQFDGSEPVLLSDFINAEKDFNGIKVKLTAEVPSPDSKVVNIKYTVTNPTGDTKKFKLGSCADTELADNDEAVISRDGNTITMTSGGYQYSIGVFSSTGAPLGNLWYGRYYGSDYYTNHVFDNGFDSGYVQGDDDDGDSAIAWSWEITLAPGASDTFIAGSGEEGGAGGGGATVVDNTGTVSMDNYTYGTAKNPSVSGYNGNPEITYYYNTTNSNEGGTAWSQAAGGSLNPGTYYMYAKLAATVGFNEYTTVAVPFTVSPADNTGTVGMSNYIYGAATEPSVSGYNGTPVITYYYNTMNSSEGGTLWSLDAGGSLNAGTYYMYAVLAATDCYKAYTTTAVPFTVNPIVYDAGSSSDAIDLEVVPDNLGAMDGTNGPTDLAAFLEDYQKMHVNPAYIRLKLKAGGNYVITRSLKTFSAIHILGDKDYPSHIDASQLGAKPFVIIDRNHQVNEKNEKGFLTSIYNVEFKDIVVTGLKGQVFYADKQKYLIPYFTVDNCVFRMEGASKKTFFDFNGGGFVENLTVTNSTLSGDDATQWQKGGFFSTQSGSKLDEAGAQKFTLTLSNNTFYNVAKGQDLSSLRQNSQPWMSFTIKDNVIVNSGKNGQFVKGLNAGQNNGTPSWLIRNNSFTFDGADVSANEVSGASNIAIVANVTGQIVFANGDEGVAEGDFSLDACPQKEAKIGDPRWLNASKLSKYITMAEIDDDNDLAKTINNYVEQGFSKFRLEDNGRYTVKQSIVTDKAISITGENVQIDVESGDDFIKVANVAGEKAKKADGSDSNYTIVENITLKGLTIKGLTKSLVNNTSGNVVFTKISIDDDVIDFSGSSAVFALGNGYPEDLTITKSTLWSQAGHTGFLFQAQGRPKDATGSTSWTIEKSTLYQIAKGKKMNNNNSGIKGQSTTKLTLTESILFETGSNTGNEINGWLFGQNSANPVRTYNKNTYWAGNAEATGWTDSSKTGSDQTGTALTTDPGFKKPAEGDFTLSMYAAQLSEKTGDPRWLVDGGHVNPTAIETVKTAEETSLENAVIYNLNGQRVEKAQKGINIVNGKKVIIK